MAVIGRIAKRFLSARAFVQVCALLLVVGNFGHAASADTYLLVPESVLDVAKGKLKPGYGVLVKDDEIVAVAPMEELVNWSRGAKRIDLKGLTLMPGLIDAHSHILLHPYNETSWTDQVLRETWAERTLRAGLHLEATLFAGFTSLRDLGSEGAGTMDVGIRKSLEKGVITGPRLIVAGRAIVATGSYGPKGFDPSHQIYLGAEEADGGDLVRVVRGQIGAGADIIKFYADYRWGPNGEARPTFSLAEMKLIVETAASSGRPTVAHASTDEGMRRATLAGVQSIEHGDSGSLKTFKLMAKRGVILCPTLAAGDAISQYRGWDKASQPEPARITAKRAMFKRALDAGVTICSGSDVGVFSHGDNAREFDLLVNYGMTRAEAIKAATITGAVLMGKADTLGQVKPGYLADLIAVEGNPLEDLAALRRAHFVMLNGEIYKPVH
jgi:imidazolonepropionase-like amidohydrolase